VEQPQRTQRTQRGAAPAKSSSSSSSGFPRIFEDLPSLRFGKAGEDDDENEDENSSQPTSVLDYCSAERKIVTRIARIVAN
jgi:hypothetical protein